MKTINDRNFSNLNDGDEVLISGVLYKVVRGSYELRCDGKILIAIETVRWIKSRNSWSKSRTGFISKVA